MTSSSPSFTLTPVASGSTVTSIVSDTILSPSSTVNLTLTGLPDGVGLIPSTTALGFPDSAFCFGVIFTYSLSLGPHWISASSENPFVTASNVTVSLTAISSSESSAPSSALLIWIIFSSSVTVTLSSSTFDRELSFKVPLMVALPAASARIVPFSSTVTADVLLDSHTISAFCGFSGV